MDMGNTESDATPVNTEGHGGNQQSTMNFENGLNPDALRMSETGDVIILSEIIDLTAANGSPQTEVNTDDNYKVLVEQDVQSIQVTVGVPCVADNSEARANKSSLTEVADAGNSEARANKSSLTEVADAGKSEARANKSSLSEVADADNSDARANKGSLSEVADADNSEGRANKSSLSEEADADKSEARANKSSLSEVAGTNNSEAAGDHDFQSCNVKVASDEDSISTKGSPFTEISAAEDDDGNHALKEHVDDGNHALKEDDEGGNHSFKEDDLSFQVTVASFTNCTSSDQTKPDEIPQVELVPAFDGQFTAEQVDLEAGRAIDSSCSTSTKHRTCEPCSFDDEEREASGFCVNCLEYICSDCSRDHRRNKITRDHVVLKGDDMPEDSSQFAKIKDLMKCTVHAENDISFECKDHGILICVSCFTENHRKCEHVLDIAANEDAKESMQALLNQFETLKIRCRSLAKKKEDDKNVLIKECQELEDKGHALAAELREHLAELEAQFEKKLGNLFHFEMFKLSKETDMITEHHSTVDELNGLVSTVGRHGSKKEVIIVNKYIQDRLRKCAEELDQSDGNEQRHIKLTQTFDKKRMTSLATLKLVNESSIQAHSSSDIIPDACGTDVKNPEKEKEKKEAQHTKHKTNKGDEIPSAHGPKGGKIIIPKEETQKKANPTRKRYRKKEIDAGNKDSSKQQTTKIQTNKKSTGKISSYIPRTLEPTQKTPPNPNLFMNKCLEKRSYDMKYKTNVGACHIIDCTMLPDGQMAFLDYGNKSLKLCSPDFVIKMMLEFNDRPVSICSETQMTGDTSKIFISFENSKQILHYKVTPTAMTTAGSFSVSLYPICIRMVHKILLVLSSDRKREDYSYGIDGVLLSLRGQNGQLIKEKKLSISHSPSLLHSKIISVSGSTLISAGSRLIAGHHFDPRSDDWIGKQKWVSFTDQLAPYVDADANGNVYVCSAYSDDVQQVLVSSTPPLLNTAFLSGVKQATCLFVDSERNRIIVGAKHDEVVVYTF